MKVAGPRLNELSTGAWRVWIETIVDYRCYPSQPDAWVDKALLARAYTVLPDEVLRRVSALMRRENAAHGGLLTLWRYENCWDDRFAATLLSLHNSARWGAP